MVIIFHLMAIEIILAVIALYLMVIIFHLMAIEIILVVIALYLLYSTSLITGGLFSQS